jgi:hypothetical protein
MSPEGGPDRGRPLVYLSGPITANEDGSVERHVLSALAVYLDCVRLGIPAICPHLGAIFPSAWTVVTYDQWLAQDFALIARCSHVLMLPGWERSRGARAEKGYAESIGVRVLENVTDALDLLA